MLILASLHLLVACFSILFEYYRLPKREREQGKRNRNQSPSKFDKPLALFFSIFGKTNIQRGFSVVKRSVVVHASNVVQKLLDFSRRCGQKKFFGLFRIISKTIKMSGFFRRHK